MTNHILSIIQLMRLNSPTGYLLAFFPACFGFFLTNPKQSDFSFLLLFFIGSIIVRSAGCIINDILDKDFDKEIRRTKNRPLASAALSFKTAMIILSILLFIGFTILLTLTNIAIYVGLIAMMMIAIYPLMKRITYIPQVFLGLTFNLGALIAYASILYDLSISAFLMYAACCFWTIGYDTIYGFMDLQDDQKIGVKSIALLLVNGKYKIWILLFYLIFILLFTMLTYTINYKICTIVGSIFAGLILIWQVVTLNIKDHQNCLARFKSNNYVGFILFITLFFNL